MSAKLTPVLAQSRIAEFPQKLASVEILNTAGLAAKLTTPESWIRSRVQPRCPESERIPHLRLGRYIRFLWNSPELNDWIESRKAR